MKVVINKCYGGFGLSMKGESRLAELQGIGPLYFYKYKTGTTLSVLEKIHSDEADPDCALTRDYGQAVNADEVPDEDFHREEYRYGEGRDNPLLVQVVEELGEAANGRFADLAIVEIPDDVSWHIHEYNGYETVAEDHRTWG